MEKGTNKSDKTKKYYDEAKKLFPKKESPLLNKKSTNLKIENESKDEIYLNKLSSEKYKKLFDENLIGIYKTSLDGSILEANKKFVKMLGYNSIDEIKKYNFSEIYKNISIRDKYIRELSSKGHLENIKHELHMKDGTPVSILKNVSIENDQSTGNKAIRNEVVNVNPSENIYDELENREAILNVLAETASMVVKENNINNCVNKIIKNLGEIVNVSRVYIFQNYTDKNGEVYTSHKFEWTAIGIEPQIDNPLLQNVPFVESGYGRWLKHLQDGKIIEGSIESFPPSEQKLLRAQNILSLIVFPIVVNNKLWGMIGFDSCDRVRIWKLAIINTLKAASQLIGSLIQRASMEKEIKRKQLKLNEAYQIAGLGHLEYDLKIDKFYPTDGILKIFEVDYNEFPKTFRGFLKFLHADDRKIFASVFKHSMQSQKSESMIIRVSSKQGRFKKIWLKWKLSKFSKNKSEYVHAIAMDITRRLEAEERIMKLAQVVEHCPSIVYISDNEGKIEYVNRKFEEVTGFKLEEVKGKKTSLWDESFQGEEIYEEMLDTIYSGNEWTGKIKNLKKNGELFSQSTSISPLVNKYGDITHYVAVALDFA